ncbi:MAG: 16S rRNA (guanine(966)-N(2))-methyltransferase RsmD [Desulfamplus sp.]|nr:16S rRNA (guanine(966)-N(2))-methyltransferase RsmD [Desulfamplus sp.]
MRIISGTCKGRRLIPLKGMSIRPTSDKVRESIFNIIGQQVNGADVLDLFAGTGAFGIECLSRGANKALFVDIAKSSCDVIKQNIELCKFTSKSVVFQYDLLKILSSISTIFAKYSFDLIFMDPPYEMGFIEKILKNREFLQFFGKDTISKQDIREEELCEDSIIILEHSIKEKIPDNLEMLDIYDQRQYGKTLISFLRSS